MHAILTNDLKILIVEDEMITVLEIQQSLRQGGYQVVGYADNSEDAIRMTRNNLPELVLMDIKICGSVDGIDTAQKIKAEFDIPIIFITANSDYLHSDRLKGVDPHDIIIKPFTDFDLMSSINNALPHTIA
ncbi:response regulator [candidate division KSB1 bacterium]|nr:response regulator [candidate division KSB1 bacterium]